MATPAERRRAQRQIAKEVKARRAAKANRVARPVVRIIPVKFTKRASAVREEYLQAVLAGEIAEPEIGTPLGNSLASAASLSRWGKADPRYEAAWSKYWYHENDVQIVEVVEVEPDDEDELDEDYDGSEDEI